MTEETSTESGTYDLNSLKGLFALLLVHTVGPQTILILPGLVQGYVEQLGFSEQDAGFLASVETWGMFLAAFMMMLLVSRISWRKLMTVSVFALVLSNLASMAADNLMMLYGLRFVAGLAAGIIVVVSYAMIGLTLKASRNFGWAIFFVLVYGALVFPILPALYAQFGINGGFFLFAAFAACAIPFLGGLPTTGKVSTEVDPDAVELSVVLKVLGVLAMALYFIGQMGVWSYFFRFGIRFGLSEQEIGSALSVSQFFGMAGAFSVVLFSHWLRRDTALLLGISLSAAIVVSLFGTQSLLVFIVVAGIYQFLWNMTHPYLLGALASFDPSGRVIIYGTAMQFLGVAVGPALAALVIHEDSVANVLWLGIAFLLASLACILPPVIRERAIRGYRTGFQPAMAASERAPAQE